MSIRRKFTVCCVVVFGLVFGPQLCAQPNGGAASGLAGTWYFVLSENGPTGFFNLVVSTITISQSTAQIETQVHQHTYVNGQITTGKKSTASMKVNGNQLVGEKEKQYRGGWATYTLEGPDVLCFKVLTNSSSITPGWCARRFYRSLSAYDSPIEREATALLNSKDQKGKSQGSTFGEVMTGVAQGLAAYGGQQYPGSADSTAAPIQVPQPSRPVTTTTPAPRPASTSTYPAQPSTTTTRNTTTPTMASAQPRPAPTYPATQTIPNSNNQSPQNNPAQSSEPLGVAANQCVSVSLIEGSNDEWGLKNSCNTTIYVTFCVQNDKDPSSCRGVPGTTNVNAHSVEYTLPFYTHSEVVWAACVAPATPWGFRPVFGSEFVCSVAPPGAAAVTSGHAGSSAH